MPADALCGTEPVSQWRSHATANIVFVRNIVGGIHCICEDTMHPIIDNFFCKQFRQNDEGGGYFFQKDGTHILAAIAISSKKALSGKNNLKQL